MGNDGIRWRNGVVPDESMVDVLPLQMPDGPPCFPDETSPGLREQIQSLPRSSMYLKRGDCLIHAGSSFAHLYVIRQGVFKSVYCGQDGAEQITGFCWPRQLIGVSGLVGRGPVSDVIALENAVVCAFPWIVAKELARRSPEFMELIFSSLSDRVAGAVRDQFMLGQMTAVQRVAFFLLSVPYLPESAYREPYTLPLPMTRKDIGSYLGLTMESVSRLFAWLIRAGIIRVERRSITLLSACRLKALLDNTPEMSPLSSAHTGVKERRDLM